MFSAAFLHFMIATALIWTGLGALALVVLLIRDWIKDALW